MTMPRSLALSFSACALALVLAPASARADSASCNTPKYDVTPSGNTVSVCPCGDPTNPILRQDEATGEVVEIEGTCGDDVCFADECVPPGTYRYGYATPLSCDMTCDGKAAVPAFGEATVTKALAGCTRKGSTATPSSLVPPWGSGKDGAPVSADVPCVAAGCSMVGRARGDVLALDLLVAGAGLAVMRLGLRHGRRGSARRRP